MIKIRGAAVGAGLVLGCSAAPGEHPGSTSSDYGVAGGCSQINQTFDGYPAFAGPYDGCSWEGNVYSPDGYNTNSSGAGKLTDTAGYQCVELAVRYFYFRWGVNFTQSIPNAASMCNQSGAGFSVLGSSYTPVPGDLIVMNTNFFAGSGHVAVVDGASGGNVTVTEQNAGHGGHHTYSLGTLLSLNQLGCFIHANANSGGNLALFVRGTDNQLYQQSWTSTTGWTSFQPLGGFLASGPAAVSWAPGRIDVFARGTDDTLIHAWWNKGTGWEGWESLGGQILDTPAVSSWAPGRLDVFAQGYDHQLAHIFYDNGWSSWEALGGQIVSGPGAVSWGPGRIDVFAEGTDWQLYHKWYQSNWSDWEALGGQIIGSPAVTSWGPGRLDVFASGTDNQLYHLWYQSGWSSWEGLGGTLFAPPGAVSRAPNSIDVFVIGANEEIYHKGYSNGWSGFEDRNGQSLFQPGASSW